MTSTALDEYRNSGEFNFTPSYKSSNPIQPKIFLFLHIAKCGGMDFSTGIIQSLKISRELYGHKIFGGRADHEDEFQHGIYMHFNTLDRSNQLSQYRGLISTMLGYNYVKKLISSQHIITILRNPLNRLLSWYSYQCMRSNQKPNLNDFQVFYKDKANINMMQKAVNKNLSGASLE
ncbi:MAG: sulfotransferase family 2 domain-containing protein, partial [Planctomycetes bacterium]|nr:sulfotransferase family 2 domain-containing protein [Planctomycetota bacterium]